MSTSDSLGTAADSPGVIADKDRLQSAKDAKWARWTTLVTAVAAAAAVAVTTVVSVNATARSAADAIRETSAANLDQLLTQQRINAHADYEGAVTTVIVAADGLGGNYAFTRADARAAVARLDAAILASYAPHGRVDLLARTGTAKKAADLLNDQLSKLDAQADQRLRQPSCTETTCVIGLAADELETADVLRNRYIDAAKADITP